MPHLTTLDHPIVSDIATQLRDENTQPAAFRRLTATVGTLLAYEATKQLATQDCPVQTPVTQTVGQRKMGTMVIGP